MKKTPKPNLPHKVSTITSLTDVQIKKLTKKQLLDIAKWGQGVAETRRTRSLKAISKHNLPMPLVYGEWTNIDNHAKMLKNAPKDAQSYRYIDFSVSSKMTINQLRNQFHYIRNFLSAKTSTVGDWKDHLKTFKQSLENEVEKMTGERKTLRYLNREQFYKLWDIYNRLKDSDMVGYSSTQVQLMVYNSIVKKTLPTDENGDIDIDLIIDNIKQEMDKGYERSRLIKNEIQSDPFDLGSN